MNRMLTRIILGGAAAGFIFYYIKDRKGAQKFLENVLEAASSTLEKTLLDLVRLD